MTAPGLSALTPTPDDGRRLSPTPVWDEADRPQAVPGAGPPPARSARGLAAAQSLLDVHGELREQLERIRELVDDVTAERITAGAARSIINEMALRQQRWSVAAYCSSYCMLVTQHHWGEDVEIFPRLRRGQADLGSVLDRLEEEHVVIHHLLNEIDATLVRIVGGRARPADLSAVVDRLSDALLSHLSYEERELLAPMAAVFG